MKYILIAEDDRFISNAYRVKLEKEGFEVKIAINGDEALNLMTEKIPDLMIIDLMMPIVDGFTLLTRMKKDERFKNIKTIIVSSLSQKEDLDRGMALGADDYFVKSEISIEDFVKKIKSQLKME
jgi:two-component system, OmpR family, alkaline phosphatase synthesis response regulator PhoP